MYLNKRHPHYSFAQELLMTIPSWPGYAVMKDLCEDFGELNQRLILQTMKQFRAVGIVIDTGNLDGERFASIEESCWPRARRQAKEYWQKVYGGLSLKGTR